MRNVEPNGLTAHCQEIERAKPFRVNHVDDLVSSGTSCFNNCSTDLREEEGKEDEDEEEEVKEDIRMDERRKRAIGAGCLP